MDAAKSSSSRVQLIFVVLLVGAFAGANCGLEVVNFSEQALQYFEVTTPGQTVLTTNTAATFLVDSPPQGQSSAQPETVTVFKFVTAPDAANNVTGVREAFPFLIAYVWDNATVTITEASTSKKVGFSIDYTA